MKEIKFEIPEGYEIDIDKSSFKDGNIALKKKENTLPTTNEEAIEFLPKICYYLDGTGEITRTVGYRDYPNTIVTKELAEAFLALIQLVKFRDIWNEGWVPDWAEKYQIKYVIYFYTSLKTTTNCIYSQYPLTFKSEEIRDKFSETFDELIQTAKPLL